MVKGGGLVMADLGWGWLQLHRGKTLQRDHPGNRLLAPAGIVWADGTLRRTSQAGFAATPAPQLCHAGRALDMLLAHARGQASPDEGQIVQAVAVLCDAVRSLPVGDRLLLPRLREVQRHVSAAAFPTPDRPLRMGKDPLAWVVTAMQLWQDRNLPAGKIRAHPAAEAFPGAVPKAARRVSRQVSIDTAVPGWHSTGLYAPPAGGCGSV